MLIKWSSFLKINYIIKIRIQTYLSISKLEYFLKIFKLVFFLFNEMDDVDENLAIQKVYV